MRGERHMNPGFAPPRRSMYRHDVSVRYIEWK
jgi:hypothetical protein